jgi:chitinase
VQAAAQTPSAKAFGVGQGTQHDFVYNQHCETPCHCVVVVQKLKIGHYPEFLYSILRNICNTFGKPETIMISRVLIKYTAVFLFLLSSHNNFAQQKKISIIGYYAGPANKLDSFPIQKLTHLIFSFGHLKGNRLSIDNAGDSACIRKMVSFKQQQPSLKIILSLGGWGGCRACSPVFATQQGRKEFALSVKELSEYFHTDGIDLDWEYPAIAGYPGHAYSPSDKKNFTSLIRELRNALGEKYEISFAAGGFDQFIDESIEWKAVMKMVDKVNIMTYDLVHGNSTVSGHHTPLYSTSRQKQSTNNAVTKLLAAGVPASKMIIGAAFYARFFSVTDTIDQGLYRPAHFYHGLSYPKLYDSISPGNGFIQYWDGVAQAPYAFHPGRKVLVTYDDSISIRLKTQYVIDRKLGGIMFWQLLDDRGKNGLLDVMYRTTQGKIE